MVSVSEVVLNSNSVFSLSQPPMFWQMLTPIVSPYDMLSSTSMVSSMVWLPSSISGLSKFHSLMQYHSPVELSSSQSF